MRYPEFLKDGGSIGLVAPSFGCATETYKSALENALKKFNEAGYKTILGPNCHEDSGIGISNSPELCGEELTQMYCSEENDILISCGGGELMCEILEHVDFDRIRQSQPKWFLGYSDNTNFTFLQTVLCDTASVYGPCAGAFGMEPWHDNIRDTWELLRGNKLVQTGYGLWEKESLKLVDNPLATINATEPRVLKLHYKDILSEEGESSFSGRLIGGCMDCLVNLLGTKYDKVSEFNKKYADDGIIWFLESCDLNVFAIRRAMWQMYNAGWFENVRGFIIGRPAVFGQEMMGLDQYEAVTGIIGQLGVPIIMDADIGHISPAMPIICGSVADVRLAGQQFMLSMSLR